MSLQSASTQGFRRRVDIGALRHRITIEEPISTQDEYGEPLTTWDPFATVWASVEPLRGAERWAAQQVRAEVTHRVTVRWLEDVSPTMRVMHRGRVLEIDAVTNPSERREMLELLCIERVP